MFGKEKKDDNSLLPLHVDVMVPRASTLAHKNFRQVSRKHQQQHKWQYQNVQITYSLLKHNSKCFWQTPRKSNKFVEQSSWFVIRSLIRLPSFGFSFLLPSLISHPFSIVCSPRCFFTCRSSFLFFVPGLRSALRFIFLGSFLFFSVTFPLTQSMRFIVSTQLILGCCEMWFFQVTCSAAPPSSSSLMSARSTEKWRGGKVRDVKDDKRK